MITLIGYVHVYLLGTQLYKASTDSSLTTIKDKQHIRHDKFGNCVVSMVQFE